MFLASPVNGVWMVRLRAIHDRETTGQRNRRRGRTHTSVARTAGRLPSVGCPDAHVGRPQPHRPLPACAARVLPTDRDRRRRARATGRATAGGREPLQRTAGRGTGAARHRAPPPFRGEGGAVAAGVGAPAAVAGGHGAGATAPGRGRHGQQPQHVRLHRRAAAGGSDRGVVPGGWHVTGADAASPAHRRGPHRARGPGRRSTGSADPARGVGLRGHHRPAFTCTGAHRRTHRPRCRGRGGRR